MGRDGPGRRWLAVAKRCRIVLFFALGLVALDAVVGAHRHVWKSYDPKDYRERIECCRRQPRDLVIIGGSPAGYAIDPAVLAGMHWQGRVLDEVYSLGIPLATTSEIFHATEHGIDVPPQLLVYGITATDLNDDRRVPEGPRFLMDARDVLRWVHCRPKSAGWCLREFGQGKCNRVWKLFDYRNGIRLWAAERLEQLWPGCCPQSAAEAKTNLDDSACLAGHGFRSPPDPHTHRLDQFKAAGSYGPPFPYMDHFRLGEHVKYLHHLLDWAEARHIPLILVDLPVPADLEERLFPREFAEYRAVLEEVERSRGVRVVRASRAAVGLDDADFADLIHLNAAGAARLSSWLRHCLES
jgi:hypothetical protein